MTMKLASSPGRNSSITTSRPASPNWPANIACAAVRASSMERAMTTPLPAARPLALTTSRALAAQPRAIEAVAREGRGAGRRNAMASQEFLGKGLGALEPRSRLARSEALQSARGECVDRACHQRCLRSDDGELDLLGGCQLHEPRDVLRRDVHVADLGFRRGARVAGSHQHARDARRGGALPGERVLTATRPDDQNLHG